MDNVREFKSRDIQDTERFFNEFAETFDWGTHFILLAYNDQTDLIEVGALCKNNADGKAIWLGILDIAKDHILYGGEED